MKKFHQQRKGSTDTSKDQLIIYGRHAVISALKNPRRKIQKLLISAENRIEVEKAAPQVPATVIDKKDFAKFLPGDAVHQGFALYCSRLETCDISDLIALVENKKRCCILILDQVTDPQNIGAIIRSCAAFETLGLIVQDKNSPAPWTKQPQEPSNSSPSPA